MERSFLPWIGLGVTVLNGERVSFRLFRLNMRKRYFTVGVVRHWYRLFRGAADAHTWQEQGLWHKDLERLCFAPESHPCSTEEPELCCTLKAVLAPTGSESGSCP